MAFASLEGRTLGKYRILEALGRGGMARVYRAYHPQLDRYVAVKVLRSDLVEEEKFLARFRREAQAVAALRHPNIVQVYDFDVQDDITYMVMELLEGDTLKVRLNDYRVRDEPTPLGEMVRVLLDVLDGLAYAHSEGMIHRDVKPANILLTRRGQAVITDFGIAQIVGSTHHTAAGALMGTLNYIAPEQGLEGYSDARSDIYSLGIVLYEMLTRRTPFDADTPLAILMKHLNEPLPLPRQVNPQIPEPFERVVLKALAKEPDGRYQSAEEMAQALRKGAEQAEIELPDRISLPLSFTTAEAPSESVAVFSGTAREKIADAQFAADDTDETLGKRLAAERAASEAAELAEGEGAGEGLGEGLLSAMGALGRLAMDNMAEALREGIEAARRGPPQTPLETESVSSEAPPEEMPPAALDQQLDSEPVTRRPEAPAPPPPPLLRRWGVGRAARQTKRAARKAARTRKAPPGTVKAILGTIWLLIIANLMAVWVAGITGWWEIFGIGWPVELLLLSLGLCMIMAASEFIWLLIPTGIILGNGVLFAYCSLTNNWEQWLFLWPLEPLLLVGTVWSTMRLAGRGEYSRRLARALGWVLGLMSLAWIAIVTLGVLGAAVLSPK